MQNWSFRVWGCRGGISVDGPEYERFGGLTTCLELEFDGGRIFIDAGTGFARAGRELPHDGRDTLLFITHLHADHIKGFPFFTPLFVPGWNIDVIGCPRESIPAFEFICSVHRPPMFPVPIGPRIEANLRASNLGPKGQHHFRGVDVDWCEVWHPGGCSAVSLSIDGRRIVFSGDLEVDRLENDDLHQLCKGADLLIFDAQYAQNQYPNHLGYGHSTNLQAARFAREAGVGRLLLTHHDPRHDDATIDRMVAEAQAIFPNTQAAACGMVVRDADLMPRSR